MSGKPQWQQVLEMLQSGDVTTAQFCSTIGLASEYRRAISELRRKGHIINPPTRLRQGCYNYHLEKTNDR